MWTRRSWQSSGWPDGQAGTRSWPFAPDGKLEKLCLAGMPNLLFEWDHEVDLGGKFFRPAGWDECFPTIDPTADSPVMGDLIGLTPILSPAG